MTRRVAVFGAGNIGRGLLGWLFGRAGWEVVFIDISCELVKRLNREGAYQVVEVSGAGRSSRSIGGIRAVDGTSLDRAAEATASADLVCTAVGAGVLDRIAPTIAAALSRDDHRIANVIACENADPNTARLRRHVEHLIGEGTDTVGFPETLVDRMVPGTTGDGLSVEVESLFDFKVAAKGWRGDHPGVPGVELVDDLPIYRKRKLWLVNGLHAAAAYLGMQAGHRTIAAAVTDPAIRTRLEEAAATMAEVLSSEYSGWTAADLGAHGRANLERFAGTTLVDPVHRVGRHPLRKLGPAERLTGPARAAARRGLPIGALCDAIAAGLSVTDPQVPGLPELREALDSEGWQAVLGLEDQHDGALIRLIGARLECPAPDR